MKIFFKLSLAIGMLAIASEANAACVKRGYIDQVFMYAGTTPGETLTLVFLRPSSEFGFRYYATTPDPTVAAAANANVGGRPIEMRGEATTCPTTGIKRFMGKVEVLVINP